MPQETLEARVKTGPLAEIFPLFDTSTLRHADEAMAFREQHPDKKNVPLWTANFSMYRKEADESFLYFTRREHNLFFRALENEATRLPTITQLLSGNYIPPKDGIDEVVAAANEGKALKIKISDLQLQKHNPNDEYGFFDIELDNLDALNPTQKSFVQAIYGNSRPGTRVYVLTSDYVTNTLKRKEESAIARASRLGWAGIGSGFCAGGWVVGSADGGLLGVLKDAPKAPQKVEDSPLPTKELMPYNSGYGMLAELVPPALHNRLTDVLAKIGYTPKA